MENPVQHGSGKYGIPHHLCPVHDLLVRGKYDGGCFVGITDEREETVGLAAGNRGIADFIDDKELSLLQVPETKTGGPLSLRSIKDLHKAYHLLKADSVTAVDGVEP